jgi:hypothetical protein
VNAQFALTPASENSGGFTSNDEDSSYELNTSDINLMHELEPSEDNTSLKIPVSKSGTDNAN